MRFWMIALASAAGIGLAAEEAFADRGRHGQSSASRPHHHSKPHHGSRPQRHHAGPRHHHHHARPHHRHYGHARSHHHHYRYGWWPGLVIAPAFAAGYYYAPPPVYAAPPAVVAPPVVPSLNSGYWYYCPDNRLYYPYAVECPSGWMQVRPDAVPPG